MKIDLDMVRHVAELARLSLSEEQMNMLLRQMNDILVYMEQLNELDTTGVEPTSHVMELSNAFREDRVRNSLPLEKSLQNAPEADEKSFIVPRVI